MIEYRMVKLSMYPLMLGAIEAIVRGRRKSNFSVLLGVCHDDVSRYGIFLFFGWWPHRDSILFHDIEPEAETVCFCKMKNQQLEIISSC